MGRREFGNLVREYRQRRGRSLAWVASMLSHPPHGTIWTGTGVKQLQNGQRRISPDLANELILILDIDPDEAYHALGWWPRDVTRNDVQEFRRKGGQRDRRSDRELPNNHNNNPALAQTGTTA